MAKLEDLREIARVVSRNKAKNIPIIGNNRKNEADIFDRFYQALVDNRFQTDQEHLQFLYGEQGRPETYYKLKDRLETRLINTLFFIDVNQTGFEPIQKAYYTCYKNSCALWILMGRFAKKSAITIAEKTIKLSLKFDFTEVTLTCAKFLRLHYGHFIGDLKKFKYYDAIIRQYYRIYEAELLCERYHSYMSLIAVHTNKPKKKDLINLEKHVQDLKILLTRYSSSRINTISYLTFLMYYEYQFDYRKVLETTDEAIRFFRRKKNTYSKSVLNGLLLRKIAAYLVLGRYKEGESVAKECRTLEPEGTHNWFLTSDYLLRHLFHSGQLKKAKSLFVDIKIRQNPRSQFQMFIESWKIHEAFINYLVLIGKVEAGEGEEKLPPFRISKFLNEVPVYSRDKRGHNITILVLQILFLLEQGKYDVLIERAEPLKTYTQRYLKDDETFRSNCFIKMLLCLPAAGFEKTRVVKKAKKYRDLLYSMPIEKAKQSAELEVMPYEMLWEFALESLDRAEKNKPLPSRR